MSIATEITRLQGAKTNLTNSIVAKKNSFLLTNWALSGTTRVYCFSNRSVVGGETIYVKLNDYSVLEWNAIVISSNTWGTGAVYAESGWVSEERSYTVPVGVPVTTRYWLRFQFRKKENATITIDDVTSAIETLTLSNSIPDTEKLDVYYKHVDRLSTGSSAVRKVIGSGERDTSVLNNSNVSEKNYFAIGTSSDLRGYLCIPIPYGTKSATGTVTVKSTSTVKCTIEISSFLYSEGTAPSSISYVGYVTPSNSNSLTVNGNTNAKFIGITVKYNSGTNAMPTYQEFIDGVDFELKTIDFNSYSIDDEYLGTITTLPASTYRYATSYVTMIIPSTITQLNGFAFADMPNLSYVNLENVTTFQANVFNNSGIKDVYLPKISSIGDNSFGNCKRLIGASFGTSLTSIPSSCFAYSNSLVQLSLPQSITSIGNYAFRDTNLTGLDLYLPKITTIGNYSFATTRINSIKFGGDTSVTSAATIEDHAFYNCYYLSRVDLSGLQGRKVTISTSCFEGSSILYRVKLPTDVKFSGSSNFANQNSSATYDANIASKIDFDLDMSNSETTTLGGGAFYRSYLKRIVSLGNVTTLATGSGDRGLFRDCKYLISATLPSTLTTIGDMAFAWCPNLPSITIPSSVTTIGTEAFRGNTQFTGDLSLPGVTSIGIGAFRETGYTRITSLGSITQTSSSQNTANGAFCSMGSLTEVYLPDGLLTVQGGSFRWDYALTTVHFPTSITAVNTEAFEHCPITGDLSLPNATTIGNNAFYNSRFTTISLPSVTTIGSKAFGSGSVNTTLITVTLSSTLTSINNQAFANRRHKVNFTLPASTPPSITASAFENCTIEEFWVPAGKLTTYCGTTNYIGMSPKIREIGTTYSFGTIDANKDINVNTKVEIYHDSRSLTDFVPVTVGNTVWVPDNGCNYMFYNSSKTGIAAGSIIRQTYNGGRSLTVPANAAYIRISFPNNQGEKGQGIYDATAGALIYPFI